MESNNTTDRVKFNVSGMVFEVSMKTIKGSKKLMELMSNPQVGAGELIFIERSPFLFDHVPSLLRDDKYAFPLDYLSELKYYKIEITPNIRKRFKEAKEEKAKIDYCFLMLKKQQRYCDNGMCVNYAVGGLKWCLECGEIVPSNDQKLRDGVLMKFSNSQDQKVYKLMKMPEKGDGLKAYRYLEWEPPKKSENRGVWDTSYPFDATDTITIVEERLKVTSQS